MSDLNKVLKDDKSKEIAEYIKNHPMMVFSFRKIFNNLCTKCRSRALRKNNGELNYDDFCEDCKQKAKKILGVKE